MAGEYENGRSRWFVPLIAFMVGLLAGWLVIGWGVWPVTYKNALPQDLRPAERDEYLSLVAESYALNGNLELAKQRLAAWPVDQLGPTLGALQVRLAEVDPRLAGDVQLLGGALGAPAAVAPVAAGEQPAAGETLPTASPIQPGTAGSAFNVRKLCSAGLWVLGVLAGIAALVLLFNRLRRSRADDDLGDTEVALRPGFARSADEIAEDTKRQWVDTADQAERAVWEEARAAPLPKESAPAKSQPATPPVSASSSFGKPITATPVRKQPTSASNLVKLTENLAVYQLGDVGYDEAFDVHDPDGAYLGQCGLQLNDLAVRDRDQAASLQVWLWDSTDPVPHSMVLLSEGAYRDTALRSQLAAALEPLAVRPDVEFELESLKLLLKGKVEKADYAETEPFRTYFNELQVRLTVYRKKDA